MKKSNDVIGQEDIFDKDSEVIYASEGDVLTLFSPHANKMTEVHGIGPHIWYLLDGTKDVVNIVLNIVENYDVSYEEAMVDTQSFLFSLLERRLCVKKDT